MDSKIIADKIFKLVKNAGAEADLIVNESKSLSLKAQAGVLDEHSVSSSYIVGLRVVHKQRVGAASSEAMDEESLTYLVEQALMNAQYSEEKPTETISDLSGELSAETEQLNPVDDATVEQKIDFILNMEQQLASRKGIRNVPYNALVDAVSRQEVFTSHGRHVLQESRKVLAYVYPLAEEGELTAMAAGAQYGRCFQELDAQVIIERAYIDSMALLSGKPIPTKHYEVIFDTNTQHDLLSAFSMMWSAKAAQEQVNPLRDKVGQSIFDPRISIVDDPLNVDGLGYSKFDDEGTLTTTTTFVENGILLSLAHNSATAKYFSVGNTGHAARGVKTPLAVGLHQMHLLAGPDSQLVLTQGEYVEVTSLDGLHSGTNPISGEFSCGASGYLCRDGERVSAVRGVTVAGNLYQMFNNIAAVGDLAYWSDSKQSKMATIRFADVAISGS